MWAVPSAGSLGTSISLKYVIPPQLPPTFLELLGSSSIEVLRLMKNVVSKAISDAEGNNNPPPENISDYVEHIEYLGIDDTLAAGITKELGALQLKSRSSTKIKTKWLTPKVDSSSLSKVIKNPQPIDDCPNICKLLDLVNNHPSTTGNLNSCLISRFSFSGSRLSLHRDNEELVCQDSSIATVSFGEPRTLEFVHDCRKAPRNSREEIPADFSVDATDRTMNVMKPGSQHIMRHRIPKGTHIVKGNNVRFSLSFRNIKCPQSLPSSSTTSIKESDGSTNNMQPVILVAGDSFYNRLDADKLGKGKKAVINIAASGSKMEKVQKAISDFVINNPCKRVTKCFISIGTNDIRNCTNGIKHLKSPLCSFMKSIKTSLPSTKIFLQSLIPIPSGGSIQVQRNVISMNGLLYDLYSRYKLYFIDAFRLYVDNFGRRILSLFPSGNTKDRVIDIHPNSRGMGVMAKNLIFLIHSKWCNPFGY